MKQKMPAKSFTLQFALCFLLFAFSFSGFSQQNVASHARAVITPALMRQTIGYLASDSMKGRSIPSEGLDRAGDFIARQFRSFGMQPFNGNYFQNLEYCTYDLGPNNFLSVVKEIETKNFKIGDDFVPYDISGNRPAEGGLVFAGYGITAPEFGYDDYQDLDIAGKIAVILRMEPGQADSAQKLFGGLEYTRHCWLTEKLKNAQEHGAVGILVVSGPLQYTSLGPRGFPWPSLSENVPKEVSPIDYCGKPEGFIPMVSAGESVINELFGSADSLRRIQERIEKNMKPGSFPFPGRTAALNVSFTSKPVDGHNVIAWLEGSDPVLKNEAIIIGGHYDHIGYQKEHVPGSDYIYNGADDNASGTSGVLAAAKTFATMIVAPKRSVIFIAFAGEEKGLLGSATYIRKPLWPLGKTVAMLDLDMISRNNPDSLEIIGAKQNPGLVKVVRKQNRETGFILAESKSKHMDGGSDHASFFNAGIPAIFFFTGLHADYHQVTDSPERINPEKAARVARLAFLTAWTIANENRHYKIIRPAGGGDE